MLSDLGSQLSANLRHEISESCRLLELESTLMIVVAYRDDASREGTARTDTYAARAVWNLVPLSHIVQATHGHGRLAEFCGALLEAYRGEDAPETGTTPGS